MSSLSTEHKLILFSIKINPVQSDLDLLNELIPQIKNWESTVRIIIERGAGLKTKFFIYLKNFLIGLQLHYASRVHRTVKSASVVVSASSNSQ